VSGLRPLDDSAASWIFFLLLDTVFVAILLHPWTFSGNILYRSLWGENMTSSSVSVETQKGGGGYKFLGWIALPLGVVMVLVILFSHRGLYQIYRFRTELVGLEQENTRLAAENARLARTIDRLQHDPVLIQDLIRQELNFVRKNEIIFQFTPEKPVVASGNLASGNPDPASRVQALSARKIDKSQWVSPAAAGPSNKKASRRRE
jgi:cell division protein FtsB